MSEHSAEGAPEPAATEGLEPLGETVAETAADRRLYPSTLGGLLYLGVLAVTGVGLAIVALDDWRLGVTWIGGALIGAATLRLVLRRKDAGMLEVRHRFVDALLLGVVGAALVFLATSIPNQPTP